MSRNKDILGKEWLEVYKANHKVYKKAVKKHLKEVVHRLNCGGKPEKSKRSMKQWKGFAKYDYDFGWECLFETVLFKLEKMYAWLTTHIWREGQEEDLVSLKECIDLGWKIKEDEYADFAIKWFEANQVETTYVYENLGKKYVGIHNYVYKQGKLLTIIYGEDWSSDILGDNWKEELPKEASMREEFLKDKQTSLKKWLKENNLKRKDVAVSYSSVWINGAKEEDNRRHYFELLKEAEDRRCEDIQHFFNMIVENKYKWCD